MSNTLRSENDLVQSILGRQVKLAGDHPWAGTNGEVVGLDSFGLRLKLICSDAMDGHEVYATSPKQYMVIPKHLQSERR